MKRIITLFLFLFAVGIPIYGQNSSTIDSDAIIEKALSVESELRSLIKNITVDAEYIEGEINDDSEFVEKSKFVKTLHRKILPDTIWIKETVLEYYKDEKLKSEKDRDKAFKKFQKRRNKTKGKHDILFMLYPFRSDNKENYNIEYLGLANEKVNQRLCHEFKVSSLLKEKGFINGEYYIDVETFHLVRVSFRPAKLVKKMMFKIKKLNMVVDYKPFAMADSDIGTLWLPEQIEITGKGKAAFFFGVDFGGIERYSNPVVNEKMDDKLFEREEK